MKESKYGNVSVYVMSVLSLERSVVYCRAIEPEGVCL